MKGKKEEIKREKKETKEKSELEKKVETILFGTLSVFALFMIDNFKSTGFAVLLSKNANIVLGSALTLILFFFAAALLYIKASRSNH